jgi:hypothetical protein
LGGHGEDGGWGLGREEEWEREGFGSLLLNQAVEMLAQPNITQPNHKKPPT